jgi:hypothetical protein
MAHTSAFCLAQAAFQRERAATSDLENVRRIATSAAVVWAREAVVALRREAKLGRDDRLPEAASLSEELEDRQFSENPDRCLAA